MPAIPLFFLSRWQTYEWANYGPLYAPSRFNIIQVQSITQTTAQVTLMLNISGQWKVMYGTKTGEYDQVTPWVQATQGVGSAVVLQGLQPQTEYFFNVVVDGYSSNPAGLPISGCFYTDEQTFTTLGPPVPPTISSTSADPSAGAGDVDWSVGTNVACSGYIEYGLTTAYGTQLPFTSGNGLTGNLLRVSAALTPTTTYHYRAVVTGLSAPNQATTTGPDHTVTTEA